MKICTIGYEGLDIDAFMSLLAENDIETVVDVREMPLSRKPGFSKKALEAALNLSGREYVHMVALGCPKPIRDRYREDGNWKRYTEDGSDRAEGLWAMTFNPNARRDRPRTWS